MQQLVLGLALRALSGCPRTADVAAGSTEDVVEEAAVALRMLCRCLLPVGGAGQGSTPVMARGRVAAPLRVAAPPPPPPPQFAGLP